jgi:hypothetical protein
MAQNIVRTIPERLRPEAGSGEFVMSTGRRNKKCAQTEDQSTRFGLHLGQEKE